MYRDKILAAIEKILSEGDSELIKIERLLEAGDAELNRLVKQVPQDKDVIVQAARQVRDIMHEVISCSGVDSHA